MSAPRTPYQDTSVPVTKSQDEVRQMLRAAGARGLHDDMRRAWAAYETDEALGELWWDDLFLCWTCAQQAVAA